jgi:type IV secretion system protein VirD4
VAFATNDDRTARRVSDALGVATEMRAMKNYAGHRLAPWLGHLMVSRQETARPLLTPGEVMQLLPADELVLVSGVPPIRAKKVRYYQDKNLTARVLPPPSRAARGEDVPGNKLRTDDWRALPSSSALEVTAASSNQDDDDPNSGIRREPALPEHEAIASEQTPSLGEFALVEDEPDDEAVRSRVMQQRMRAVARQAALDPNDGIEL